MAEPLWIPSVDDILVIHEDIVSEYPNTEGGVRDEGVISFTTERIEHGHPDGQEEDIHEKAFLLLRLLVVNHPFVDANKRTALDTVATFYVLNGYQLEYDGEIRSILKALATDERGVNNENVYQYLRRRAIPTDTESKLRGFQADLVEFGLDKHDEEDN